MRTGVSVDDKSSAEISHLLRNVFAFGLKKLAAALSDEELSKRTALRVDCGVVRDCPIRSFGKA
jgi:hypothetical protein